LLRFVWPEEEATSSLKPSGKECRGPAIIPGLDDRMQQVLAHPH